MNYTIRYCEFCYEEVAVLGYEPESDRIFWECPNCGICAYYILL
ncbi:hypothetical protein API480_75 [Paenibacillus phage vB_PlaP_API480]|uniref:Uncharacterized protein n=1 Tax=Paenibacillus larvae subsp. larvae TaxID=147375 RepID=A0A6C0QZW9_9BACL|nr:hypothetical protein API480_75 [Paenibacillus phage vB_PlaP_API480]QHZ53999.1 hypothetical protein ERICV_05015 [Paenibacillus larvae subsp. larvae]QHZ54071.1 hypothetical protein ERICV_05087 [Paenibacillus larvae subsp. larvae]